MTDAAPTPTAADEALAPERGLLVVRLGPARFGVWVDEVLEVVRTPPITRLPLAVPEVLGLTSVRGDILPVLDLGRRLMGEPARHPGRLVLIRHTDSASMVALLVDDVETLVNTTAADLEDPPPEAVAELPDGTATAVFTDDAGPITVLHLGRAAAPPTGSMEDA